MATIYTPKVERVSVVKAQDGLTNVIESVYCSITGVSDDGITKIRYQSFMLPSPTPDIFIDIDSLTELQVLNWISSHEDYLSDGIISLFDEMFELERNRNVIVDYKMSWMPEDVTRYNLQS